MISRKRIGPDFAIGRTFLLIASATLMLLSGASTAAEQSDESDRISLSLGVFLTERGTYTRLDGEVPGSGTEVDSEHDLGFDKADSVFRIDGAYRFTEKHRIDFSAFDLSRSSSKHIEQDIVWDGTLYPVDVLINANLDLQIYKLSYTWSFMLRERGFLGVSGGVYVADIGTSIAADSVGLSSSHATTAPLPVIGLRGQYDISENWSFRGSAEIFAFEYGDYDGSLYDLYAVVDYELTDHVSIGGGVNSVRMNIGVMKNSFYGDLDWRYTGGLLFFKFDF